MRRLPSAILAALLAALVLAATPAGAAPRQVPPAWLGVTAVGPMLWAGTDIDAEMDRMVVNGVETIRLPFDWILVQPYRTAAAVPGNERSRFRDVRGVPSDFSRYDRLVGAAARHGIHVLPVVVDAPAWSRVRASDAGSPPRDPRDYAAFLRALVERYGPNGTLWAEQPGLPRLAIRDWQLWNEPSINDRWRTQPFARSYVALLRATRPVIKRADPGARVVLAGLPNFSWRDLESIYRAGGRPHFDVAAIHPYTFLVRNVVRIVQLNRHVMTKYSDQRKFTMLTEVAWSAGRGIVRDNPGFETLTEAGQAARIAEALPALARVRLRYRISRVYWYDWLSPEAGSPNAFDYTGLRKLVDGRIVNRPAAGAYRRAAQRLEGCVKAEVATRCQ